MIRAGTSEALVRAEATEQMNEDVNRTAQPTEFVDRSLTELSASPSARLAFMMFATEARKGWALVQEAVVGAWAGKVSKEEAANVVAVAWLAVGLLEATISAAFRDAQDGDDAEWLDSDNWGWRLWTQAATGPFSGIPLIRDVIGGGKSGPTGKAILGGKAAMDIGQLLTGDENAQAQFNRHPWEWWEEKVVANNPNFYDRTLGTAFAEILASMSHSSLNSCLDLITCIIWINIHRGRCGVDPKVRPLSG